MKPVRVAILGAGSVVREFHLPALVANARAEVVAIASHRAAPLVELGRQFNISSRYTNFERLAKDPEIDAVVNALPNYLHAPVTIAMLGAGKHVLCEKPMAMTVSEAREMISAAEASGRTLMIAHVWRLHPEVQWLREVVRAGTIGTVVRAKAHEVVAERGPKPESWFVRPELSGGGALADVGIHGIDTISFVFDDRIKPRRITAITSNRYRALDVEDTASAVVEYENGLLAQIEAGWYGKSVAEPHGAIELFGTAGYARTLPARLERDLANTSEAAPIAAGEPHIAAPMYAAQIDAFLDCVIAGRQPPCDGHQGLRNMIVLEAAYASARSGRGIFPQSPGNSPAG